MTAVGDIRAEKWKMEESIREAAAKAVSEFEAATGLTPESIYISMVHCDPLGSAPVHLVNKVDAIVRL